MGKSQLGELEESFPDTEFEFLYQDVAKNHSSKPVECKMVRVQYRHSNKASLSVG